MVLDCSFRLSDCSFFNNHVSNQRKLTSQLPIYQKFPNDNDLMTMDFIILFLIFMPYIKLVASLFRNLQ